MENFEPIPAIPEEVWQDLAKLQRIQNRITAAALGILEGPPKPGDRTATANRHHEETMGTHGLMIEELGLIDIHLAVQQLKENRISFDEAVLLLSNSHGLTWNAAADKIRGAEAISGIWLEGDGPDRGPAQPPSHDFGVKEFDPETGCRPSQDLPEPSDQVREFQTTPLGQDPDRLLCTICGQAIPEARSRRQTATCSEKCKNKLDVVRARQRASKRCPACLHPSTEEERAEFRQWRAERGDRKPEAVVIGRDHSLQNKRKIIETLKRAITALQDEADTLASQLSGDLVQTKIQAKAGLSVAFTEKGRKEAEQKLERLTSLISDCKAMATPKGEPA